MINLVTRRRALALAAGGLVLAACQNAAPARGPAAGAIVAPTAGRKPGEWTPVLPSTDLAVGANRFLYAVLDERNQPIVDAKVHLRFFDLQRPEPTPVAEADATFRGQGLAEKGLYVARVELPTAGAWGIEATVERPTASQTLRTRFEVKPASQTPAIGVHAPPSRQALMAGAPDPRKICTAAPACPFHDLTVADAIAAGKPTLLLFATPAFCTSRVCGPSLETVQAIEPAFRGRASFIHIEIYDDPGAQTALPAVLEWRLPSEPWVFLIDRAGVVADKLEGGVTADELRESLARLV